MKRKNLKGKVKFLQKFYTTALLFIMNIRNISNAQLEGKWIRQLLYTNGIQYTLIIKNDWYMDCVDPWKSICEAVVSKVKQVTTMPTAEVWGSWGLSRILYWIHRPRLRSWYSVSAQVFVEWMCKWLFCLSWVPDLLPAVTLVFLHLASFHTAQLHFWAVACLGLS